MPPPKAIVCHLCNGKYFSRSYPIHLKQCEKKWQKTHSRCEYCGSAVANHDWSDHRTHCKRPKGVKMGRKSASNIPLAVPKADHQRQLPTLSNTNAVTECEECETENAIWKCVQCEQSLCAMCEVELHRKGARARHTRIPTSADALKQENIAVLVANDSKDTEFKSESVMRDHRAQCKFCQRRFTPDRVEKHMRICAKASRKKKRKIYDGAKKRIEGTPFEEYQYNRSVTPKEITEWKQNGRRWRKESAVLREIAALNAEFMARKKKDCSDKKDEESDIMIRAPAHKPVLRHRNSSQKIKTTPNSKVCRPIKKKVQKFPLKGSALKMKQRTSNKYSAKRSVNAKRGMRDSAAKMSDNKPVIRRRNSVPKKPAIPRFNRRKSVPKNDAMREAKVRSKKVEPKPKIRQKRVSVSKSVMSEEKKESEIRKTEKPAFQRKKSEATALPRGIDLGVNVNKMFSDQCKTMNDYVERERLRRQRKTTTTAANVANKGYNKQVKVPTTKKMSRLQIKKEIRIENQAIGGKRANKPSNAKDLSEKRAQYFESLLQNQD